MGRYCFYCGRKLEPGELCDCPTARKNRGENFNNSNNDSYSNKSSASKNKERANNTTYTASADNTNSSDNGKADGNSDTSNTTDTSDTNNSKSSSKSAKGTQESKESFRRRFKGKHKNKKNNADGKRKKSKSRSRRSKSSKSSGFISIIKNIFTSPTNLIDQSKDSGVLAVILTTLIKATLLALAMLIFIRNSNLTNLIILQDFGSTYNGVYRQGLDIFLRAFVAAILLDLLKVFVSWIILKLIGSQHIKFKDFWLIYLPGNYCAIIGLLVSLVFLNGSGLQGLVIIIFACLLRVVVDIFSIREWTSLTTNKLIGTFIAIFVILGIFFSIAVNFIVPDISNFNVLPSKKEKPKAPNIQTESREGNIIVSNINYIEL